MERLLGFECEGEQCGNRLGTQSLKERDRERERSGAKVVPLKRALKAQKFLANGRYEMPPLLYGNYSLLRRRVVVVVVVGFTPGVVPRPETNLNLHRLHSAAMNNINVLKVARVSRLQFRL